jgi:mannose-1-phosphate guanylyltransferase
MPKAVIMAGGPGERFWPLTHRTFPKYRIQLDGRTSLLQETFKRLSGVYAPGSIYVVTTREHVPLIRKELPKLKSRRILIEPFRKNTAPAILFSTAWMARRFGPDEVVTFFPADHLIQPLGLFRQTLLSAMALARRADVLVTVGVSPTYPATGLGYLEVGPKLRAVRDAFEVRCFREKPSRAAALRYLKTGNFLWNGGIFTWRAGLFLQTMKRFSPKIYGCFDLKKLSQSYERLPGLSIDYALLEKTDNLVMVRSKMGWCDMGNWGTFFDKAVKNPYGNFLHGLCVAKNARRSLIVNTTKEPLVISGVSDLIAVKTDQGVLIGRRDRAEEAALLSRGFGA